MFTYEVHWGQVAPDTWPNRWESYLWTSGFVSSDADAPDSRAQLFVYLFSCLPAAGIVALLYMHAIRWDCRPLGGAPPESKVRTASLDHIREQ